MLQRDQGIEVTGQRIITENGREVIEIEAELVNLRKVEGQINYKENQMNEIFKKAIERSVKNNIESPIKINPSLLRNTLVKVHTKSLNTSFAMDRAEILLQTLAQNVPSDLLIKTLERMNSNPAIYITDSNWNTAEDILKLERAGKASTFAYYDSIEKHLILNLDSHKYELDTLKNLELFKSAPETEIQTLIHEFGHAVDYLILNDLSHTREFKNLYEREKNNIHIENYMKQDSVEFFASTFSYMFSPNTQYRERIANEAPETVQYIKNKLKVTGLVRENK